MAIIHQDQIQVNKKIPKSTVPRLKLKANQKYSFILLTPYQQLTYHLLGHDRKTWKRVDCEDKNCPHCQVGIKVQTQNFVLVWYDSQPMLYVPVTNLCAFLQGLGEAKRSINKEISVTYTGVASSTRYRFSINQNTSGLNIEDKEKANSFVSAFDAYRVFNVEKSLSQEDRITALNPNPDNQATLTQAINGQKRGLTPDHNVAFTSNKDDLNVVESSKDKASNFDDDDDDWGL